MRGLDVEAIRPPGPLPADGLPPHVVARDGDVVDLRGRHEDAHPLVVGAGQVDVAGARVDLALRYGGLVHLFLPDAGPEGEDENGDTGPGELLPVSDHSPLRLRPALFLLQTEALLVSLRRTTPPPPPFFHVRGFIRGLSGFGAGGGGRKVPGRLEGPLPSPTASDATGKGATEGPGQGWVPDEVGERTGEVAGGEEVYGAPQEFLAVGRPRSVLPVPTPGTQVFTGETNVGTPQPSSVPPCEAVGARQGSRRPGEA